MLCYEGKKMHAYAGALIFAFFIFLCGLIALIVLCVTDDMIIKQHCPWQNTVAPPSSTSSTFIIPNILHQTWKSNDLLEIHKQYRSTWIKAVDTCHIWTDEDMEHFVASKTPWMIPVFIRLTPKIKKIDTVRYLWLYVYGGIYSDLDVSLDAKTTLITGIFRIGHIYDKPIAFIPCASSTSRCWVKNAEACSPSILASTPRHPFWLAMCRHISRNAHKYVIHATGPGALCNVLRRWDNAQQRAQINVVSTQRLGMGPLAPLLKKKYGRHHNTNKYTWKKHVDYGQNCKKIPHAIVTELDENIRSLLSSV